VANLVAIAYDDLDQSKQVMSTVGELVRERSLEVDDAVIVERRQDGKIKLHRRRWRVQAPPAARSGVG
jgi:uncharacterized membrane protein